MCTVRDISTHLRHTAHGNNTNPLLHWWFDTATASGNDRVVGARRGRWSRAIARWLETSQGTRLGRLARESLPRGRGVACLERLSLSSWFDAWPGSARASRCWQDHGWRRKSPRTGKPPRRDRRAQLEIPWSLWGRRWRCGRVVGACSSKKRLALDPTSRQGRCPSCRVTVSTGCGHPCHLAGSCFGTG